MIITSVWSSYGHRFMSQDGSEHCLTCGAAFYLSPDPEYDADSGHGYYHASNGDEPTECSGDTGQVHGEQYCWACPPDTDYPCAHVHTCNCLICTG